MFNRRSITFLIIAAIVILAGLLYFNSRSSTSWQETYDRTSKAPYGISAFNTYFRDVIGRQPNRELTLINNLEAQLPVPPAPSDETEDDEDDYYDEEVIEEEDYDYDTYDDDYDYEDEDDDNFDDEYYDNEYEIIEETISPSNYFFLGNGLSLDSTKAELLARYVAVGNNAFIAARGIPSDFLTDFLGFEDCPDLNENINGYQSYKINYDTTVTFSLVHPTLQSKLTKDTLTYFKYYKTSSTAWQYLDMNDACGYPNWADGTPYLNLGYLNDRNPNFIRIPYGEGQFYLFTTPVVFTNYFVVKQSHTKDYISGLLAHLNGGNIYWDTQNSSNYLPIRISESSYNYDPSRPTAARDETPLQYILSQKSLAWAWYILLIMAVLYAFFRAKRRQRIIPILEPNSNTSLEFVETIGTLYWQQNDHRELAVQQMQLWNNHINARYQLSFKATSDNFADKLAAVSAVPKQHILKILEEYRIIKNSSQTTEDRMINFHQLLEYFYKNGR